jgi:hypothetical protein
MAVFRKEWREFAIPFVLLGLAAAFVALPPKVEAQVILLPLLAIHGTIGVLAGAWQAFLDRRAMGDAFLRHRPIGAWRLHAARSAAGLAVVVALSLVSLATLLLVPMGRGIFPPLDESARAAAWLWPDWSGGLAVFAVAFAVAGWAAVRLGASMGGRLGSLLLAATLPSLLALSASGTGSNAGAVAIVVVAAAAGAVLVVVRQSCGVAAGGTR